MNITPDIFKHVPDMKGFHQPLPDLFAMECVRGQGLGKVFNVMDKAYYISLWDPMQWVLGPSNDSSVSFETVAGRKQLTPEKFMKTMDEMRPDMTCLLSDHIKPSSSGMVWYGMVW
eukprot:CAMPEP_0170175548 /NCGR_PEP_ID=MMETSP0040_2-20121228/8610_1 /TAXON_ID=641309 /ORGANISM="Lotharella oceanica, Strain CCMP622" /LENGTH=115 /DNA_ID=CAMNT_0010417569 /DNA_START=14 /DNA_END=358 /DNA_ORIENTATION=+